MARRCSFCGKAQRGVDRLVAGHRDVAICGDCARLAVELSAAPDSDGSGDLLLTDIGVLITNDRRHGGLLGALTGAAVAVRRGRVTWVGRQRALPDRYRQLPELACEGRMVSAGFVDAHRHLGGESGADLGELTDRVAHHIGRSLEQGATTVEVRTWGASGPEAEVTMLSAIGAAGQSIPIDIVPAVVAGADPNRGNGYRPMLESVLIPAVSRIASYLDLVVGGCLDAGAATEVIEVGRRHGMRPRVHVDDREGLEVALSTRAVSVDGMRGLSDAAAAVAESGTVMVGIPAVSWIEGRPDPMPAMWAAGAVVALGTGCATGSVATMPTAMSVAVHHCRLTPEQALWSATRGGALAVEEPDKGVVSPGAVADLVVLDAETPSDLVSEPGADPVVRVIKDGAALGT